MNGLTSSAVLWSASSNSSEYISNNSSSSKKYRTMTVQFNITQTPGYGTYLGDAVDMTYGKSVPKWQEFFGYKPCLFQDGKVVGYLDPNDYNKFEDGTPADITTGGSGDVMVEFPRRGIKISKSGTTVTVSMTDNPNASGFTYYAHTRGSIAKDYFYIGAHIGYVLDGKLRSLSDKMPSTGYALSNFRAYANKLGTGYMEVGYYQYLFIQCMYLLQYKGNLDSQSVHGLGRTNSSDYLKTGFYNTKGVMYGDNTNPNGSIRLFGIEDFWGNGRWWLDGYYVNSDYHILTTTDGFNNTGSGYTDRGTAGISSNSDGCISNVVGTSELGFTPSAFLGTDTNSKYFCDFGNIWSNCIPFVGGSYKDIKDAGIFRFRCTFGPNNSDNTIGGRLCYL